MCDPFSNEPYPSARPLNERGDWVLRAPGELERLEAYFAGVAYAPHSHDTYALAWTLGGVQSFTYRGAARHSLAGRTLVLHPDEKHDGRAGTEIGFHYRVVYVAPEQIQQALGGKPLPFIEGGISEDPRLDRAVATLLREFDQPLEPLQGQDALFDLAVALDGASTAPSGQRKSFDYRAAELARQYLCDCLDQPIQLEDLEDVSGRNRWQLSRDFRLLFGTSPYRYLIMRRLDREKGLMIRGESLAGIAIDCGFSDQSHMTRQFRKAYGMTPKQWLKTLGIALQK